MSTDPHQFDPDDPRLTAYALGELTDPADRARMEQLLAASPQARAELADIRSLTAALTAEYEQERAAAAAPPANVVAVPRSRWRTASPWLGVAALLLVLGLAVGLVRPVYHLEQSRSPRAAVEIAQTHPPVVARAARLEAPVFALPVAPVGPATSGTPLNELLAARDSSADRSALPLPSTAPLAPGGPPMNKEAEHPHASMALAMQPQADSSLSSRNASGHRTVVAQRGPVDWKASVRAVPKERGESFDSDKSTADATPSTASVGGQLPDNREEPDMDKPDAPSLVPRAAAKDGNPPLFRESQRQRRLFKALETPPAFNTADYGHTVENKFLAAKENPLSTFSIDVDTASYSIVRRFIDAGSLPPPDAVRVEEMLNYFPFDDAPPAPDSQEPFAIHVEAAACPWDTGHRLVRIGIKAREIERDQRPPSNLVFLLDVSGSMMPEERLPLIKQCLHLLVEKLREDDHVAIVVYAGESGLALPSTTGDHKDAILRAIDGLHAGGSTNGAAGIRLAYQVARQNFIQGGTNRVILSTDGDFNVGVTSRGDLLRLVEEERRDGVFLTVLGVGTDNLKDGTMQVLADHGNGNYAYVDRLAEGRKVLVNQMSGTLVPVAKDVKIQVEFNPAAVASYRLIGYEKRLLHKEDFNDDRVDAGEIGAGRSVTALYEVVPADQGARGAGPAVDALKYQAAPAANAARRAPEAVSREMLTVKMRQRAPGGDQSERTEEKALVDHGAPGEYANASPDFQFAAAVASFGMVLRDSPYKGDATLASALELAQAGKGEDPDGYRAGFIDLLRQTQALPQGER